MASRATQALKSGIKVMGGAKSPSYTLEFLTPSVKHSAGSYETIIVPYIEMGRDKKCHIRFGLDVPTVSRKHAAIERLDHETTIKNLSLVNPTLVNGTPIKSAFILKSGDEIQLSLEGPILRYNESSPDVPSKIGFTDRMKLVINQAVKPYKKAAILSLLLLMALAGLTAFFIYSLTKNHKNQRQLVSEQQVNDSASFAVYKKQLNQAVGLYTQILDSANKTSGDVIALLNKKAKNLKLDQRNTPSNFGASGEAYSLFKSNVYFLEVTGAVAKFPNGEEIDLVAKLGYQWAGTGFMLNDGRFVSARHCIQRWRFLKNGKHVNSEEEDLKNLYVNQLETQHDARITITFKATSPVHSFNFQNDQLVMNDKADLPIINFLANGEEVRLRLASLNNTDWAYLQTKFKSSLTSDSKPSQNVTAGSPVVVLGYSYVWGGPGESLRKVTPRLNESTIVRNGLNAVGNIDITNLGFGGSGGPVLCKVKNDYTVIGIVSAGIGTEKGFVVPMDAIKKNERPKNL